MSRLSRGFGGMVLVVALAARSLASPTETGESGLVTIPTTETLPQWGVSVGGHWNGEAASEDVPNDTDVNVLQTTLGFGVLPRLEFTGQVPVVFDTRANARDRREMGQVRLGLKYRLLEEGKETPFSAALLGAVGLGTGQPFFPAIQDRNSLFGRREVYEVMGIIDKKLYTTTQGADAVLTFNAGGLFFDQPRASHFKLAEQTVQFRRRFKGTQATFDPPFEWGVGLGLPVTKYRVGQVDFLTEWRGNTGTVRELDGGVPMRLFTGLRWTHRSGFGLRGGADFGLSGVLPDYRYLLSVTYATQPPVLPLAPRPARVPPPPPAAPIKRKLILRGVQFDFDKATISPEAKPVLDDAIAILRANPDVKLIVEGHCDAKGTDAYNDKLSARRAAAVSEYLARGGVPASRLQSVGKGKREPVASNDTDAGRAQNRRVELKVVE